MTREGDKTHVDDDIIDTGHAPGFNLVARQLPCIESLPNDDTIIIPNARMKLTVTNVDGDNTGCTA